jgi:lauroyl/myristoyl acyltransferase
MKPSALYRTGFWRLGLLAARTLPRGPCAAVACTAARLYWQANRARREVVIQNLKPALAHDLSAARAAARRLFRQFALKLADLWRYESGREIDGVFDAGDGAERIEAARTGGRGALLLTPHLGNWELGAPWLARRGIDLHVVTLREPAAGLTELRQRARARHGIQTHVVGQHPFAFVEMVNLLTAGQVVALLVDRPSPASAVSVELFGQPFLASIAPVELARASGCALLPVVVPRVASGGYRAEVLPEIAYDRAALNDRESRRALAQNILRAFEPLIRQHLDQWYHFVPVWPALDSHAGANGETGWRRC